MPKRPEYDGLTDTQLELASTLHSIVTWGQPNRLSADPPPLYKSMAYQLGDSHCRERLKELLNEM